MIKLKADLPDDVVSGWKGQRELWKDYYDHEQVPVYKLSNEVLQQMPIHIRASLQEDEYSYRQALMVANAINDVAHNLPPGVDDGLVGAMLNLVEWIDYWANCGVGFEDVS